MNFVIINNVYDNTEINLLIKKTGFLSVDEKQKYFFHKLNT